jgi:hypothetical protein
VDELGVYLHFRENSAADDDLSARVAFPFFICGFLFERVVPARSVLRFVDASPGCMMLSDQAARSMI